MKTATILVTDTGIGIEPENLEWIFTPLEQVESSASWKYQGTGLGFSLSRTLVELYGGIIWFKGGEKEQGSGLVS